MWDILGLELGDIMDKKSKRILWRHTWLKIFNLVFFWTGTSNTSWTCTSFKVNRHHVTSQSKVIAITESLRKKSGNWAGVILDKKIKNVELKSFREKSLLEFS